MDKTINIFGSSITWGAYDEKGGWVSRLRSYLEQKPDNYFVVYNLGISGDTSEGLLKRFAIENEARKPDTIIIDIGTNDSLYVNSKDKPYVPLEKFESNLSEIIKQAKKFTQEIIFIGLTKVDETKTMPVPWCGAMMYYTNESGAIYNAKIKEICEKNSLSFIEMMDLLEDADLEDGLHPNSQGHEKMFLRIKDFLVVNKIV